MHKFENITFIWTDPCDLQSCGIIVKQPLIGDNVHQFYGYKLYQNVSLNDSFIAFCCNNLFTK